MKKVKREEINDLDFIEILKKENHHNHEIIQNQEGQLFWKPNDILCAEIEGKNIKSFNYDLLLQNFENPLEIRKVNYIKYGVFGFLFTETSYGNEQELNTILTSKLTNYIEK